MSEYPLSEEEKTRRFEEMMPKLIESAKESGQRNLERVYRILSGETEQEEINPNSVIDAWAKITGNLNGSESFLLALRKGRERITRELIWRDAFLVWYKEHVPAILRWFSPLRQLMLRCWLDSADRVATKNAPDVDLGEVSERNMQL